MTSPDKTGLSGLEFDVPEEVTTGGKPRPNRQVPQARSDRPERKPMYKKNVVTFDGLDPNYHYRVVNDVDGRISRFTEAGYEFVISDKTIGDKQATEGSALDSRTAKSVGGGRTGYLMRIKREWYEEDQKAKAELVSATEKATKPNTAAGQYGPGITDN